MSPASAATHLLAGVEKMAGSSSWAWARSDSMRCQVAIDGGRKSAFASQPAPAFYALNRHRRLFSVFAAGSLALELGALLGLISRKIGRVWARSMFGLHWSIRIVAGIRFPLPTLRRPPAGGTRTVGSAKYSFGNAATRACAPRHARYGLSGSVLLLGGCPGYRSNGPAATEAARIHG